MKIAITGHAGGLGAAIASIFEEHGNTIQGFSIPEFDVSVESDQVRIIEESKDADVFVNCAFNRETGRIYKGIEQVQLFAAMYDCWKHENKHIINISSIAPDYVSSIYNPVTTMYRASKAALDTTSDQAAILNNRCRVTNIRPDWIDSEITEKLKAGGIKFNNLLKYEDVAQLIYHTVSISRIMTVTSITFKGTVN